MVQNILKNAGKIVKNATGGVINRTLARLTGSGIQTDSRIVQARARWSGKGAQNDWRVKLTIPNGSPLETYFFQNNAVLSPLYENKGMFWPLTPNMIIQHSANFNALAQTHNNYPFQAYQNSQVDQMNIIGEFPVQNQTDAKHWVATVHFLRTITKMFFGADDNLKGNPPPILHLSGYGTHMFEKVPVIVNTFVLGMALVTKLTVLFCFPLRFSLLKVTLMIDPSDGAIGSLGHSATVQPQDPFTERIKSGASPIFANLKFTLIDSS